ncbi:CDP-alcohol phosphatidyltransferase, partial [Francisella tularensis subsp. holarctica]|nr:CDP-alcohol phosphatidyltransferase [Francisella tularensis subsp. holarctica]
PGVIERAETFIVFIVMILFPNIVVVLGVIYTLLVLWTTLYRCYEFYVYDKKRSKFQ